MSVGAGSIKRAAKAAEGKTEVKAAKVAEDKAAEALKQEKVEAKAASPKPAVKVKKSKAVGENSGKQALSKKTDVAANAYITYGIGQELPIHLM